MSTERNGNFTSIYYIVLFSTRVMDFLHITQPHSHSNPSELSSVFLLCLRAKFVRKFRAMQHGTLSLGHITIPPYHHSKGLSYTLCLRLLSEFGWKYLNRIDFTTHERMSVDDKHLLWQLQPTCSLLSKIETHLCSPLTKSEAALDCFAMCLGWRVLVTLWLLFWGFAWKSAWYFPTFFEQSRVERTN